MKVSRDNIGSLGLSHAYNQVKILELPDTCVIDSYPSLAFLIYACLSWVSDASKGNNSDYYKGVSSFGHGGLQGFSQAGGLSVPMGPPGSSYYLAELLRLSPVEADI